MNKMHTYFFAVTVIALTNTMGAMAAELPSGTINSATALPPGTLLTIEPGMYDFEGNCGSVGSCLSIWHGTGQFATGVPLSPGTDGGMVIGKNQLPGGQQIYSPVEIATPGELSAASFYVIWRATVATAPFSGLDQTGLVTTVTTDASRNIFDRSSCVGEGCQGRTVLGTWHFAMGGFAIPLGSAEGCRSVRCTPDQRLGIGVRSWTVFPDGSYQLYYEWVIADDYPHSQLAGVPISLKLSGKIILPDNVPPAVADVNISTVSAQATTWQPVVTDLNGDPITCRLGLLPANGTATINSDCSSGTYLSNPGFIGMDTFTYLANDGQADSNSGTATVAVTEPLPTDPCLAQYPVTQFSQTGKQGTITITLTGNITSHTNKEAKVCPGTTLSYQSTSTQGPVICKIRNITTRGSGSLKINDHLKCTDKPAGKDKVNFKVKSGVK